MTQTKRLLIDMFLELCANLDKDVKGSVDPLTKKKSHNSNHPLTTITTEENMFTKHSLPIFAFLALVLGGNQVSACYPDGGPGCKGLCVAIATICDVHGGSDEVEACDQLRALEEEKGCDYR